MPDIIKPRVLKGFRDFLPNMEISRRNLVHALEKHFGSYGYVPIDTPVLEYAEVLLSKGSDETDKQTYRFTDHGGRDVALRFDLTVPFARFVAAHKDEIYMPFKRYHIGKAWRGENTQKGRYREFIQCDFDIVGTDAPSSDLEILLMIGTSLETIGAGEVQIRFSHRALFNRLFEVLKIEDQYTSVLRIVDKQNKIGPRDVEKRISDIVGTRNTEAIMDFITPEADNRKTLAKMASLTNSEDHEICRSVTTILDVAQEMQVQLLLDPSISRGLDYYTGLVFETFLKDLPSLGSVCSGGRYSNLTGLFMKTPLSGVGASIGLDRLMTGLTELGKLNTHPSSCDVLIIMLDEDLIAEYQGYARSLRSIGLSAEVYPEAKKLVAQFKYAEAKGIPLALIVGPEEVAAGTVNLKDLLHRESYNGLTFTEACNKAVELGNRIKEI